MQKEGYVLNKIYHTKREENFHATGSMELTL